MNSEELSLLRARAQADLRLGWPIYVSDGQATYGIIAAQDMTDFFWRQMQPSAPFFITTGGHACALSHEKLTEKSYRGEIAAGADASFIANLATCDSATPMGFTPPPEWADIVLNFAQYCGVIPCLCITLTPCFSSPITALPLTALLPTDVTLTHLVQTRFPIENAEHSVIHVFRDNAGGQTHLAICLLPRAGAMPQAPLVRVHSSCLTGDCLGSLRCDCGAQLAKARQDIIHSGGGILLYLSQEGRGIGLANKLYAYHLQDGGMDTISANHWLGFDTDLRDFSLAAQMLQHLKITRIRLLTNNPEKETSLRANGIEVIERIGLQVGRNAHNQQYLNTKAERLGHQF